MPAVGMAEDAQRRFSEHQANQQRAQRQHQSVQAQWLGLIEPLVKEFVEATRTLKLKPKFKPTGRGRFAPKIWVVQVCDGLRISIQANGKWDWHAPNAARPGAPQPFGNFVDPEVVVPEWRRTFQGKLNLLMEGYD